jgi:hypothetical protein
MSPHPGSDAAIAVLDLKTATGVWVVRSSSRTTYVLDLDRGLVMRVRGEGSQRFSFDDEWVPLVKVESLDGSIQAPTAGQVRVGERPRYLTDPGGRDGSYQWRISRVVTEIERVGEDEVAALRDLR